jgi:DnaJ homolog subfamily C member 19
MLKIILLLVLAALVVAWWRGGQQRKRWTMPADEARALLGVSPDDDADAIRAARTNIARDVLLAELRRSRND